MNKTFITELHKNSKTLKKLTNLLSVLNIYNNTSDPVFALLKANFILKFTNPK